MAYDEALAVRVRNTLAGRKLVVEKKMFGGLAFMLRGHMCVGVLEDELMVRVGPEVYAAALKKPHARVMDFTGTPSKGFVFVGSKGVGTAAGLREWVELGTNYVLSLPPKPAAGGKKKKR